MGAEKEGLVFNRINSYSDKLSLAAFLAKGAYMLESAEKTPHFHSPVLEF